MATFFKATWYERMKFTASIFKCSSRSPRRTSRTTVEAVLTAASNFHNLQSLAFLMLYVTLGHHTLAAQAR
jgi:hemoglobin-like flavoprotein